MTDYCNIVKTRMDLDSVKSKHRISRYPTVAALFTDVFLVYTNAIKYYEQRGKLGDAVVYKAAKVYKGYAMCMPTESGIEWRTE